MVVCVWPVVSGVELDIGCGFLISIAFLAGGGKCPYHKQDLARASGVGDFRGLSLRYSLSPREESRAALSFLQPPHLLRQRRNPLRFAMPKLVLILREIVAQTRAGDLPAGIFTEEMHDLFGGHARSEGEDNGVFAAVVLQRHAGHTGVPTGELEAEDGKEA